MKKLLLMAIVGLFLSGLLGFPLNAYADGEEELPSDPSLLGHPGGSEMEVKRLKQTGQGMPSVRGPFPDTSNMEFLGQLTREELGVERLVFTGAGFLSDIWGWTSPDTGDEYAIVGTSSGTAFARITDPANPEFLGIIPTTNPDTILNFWWDMKTYNNYAYITTEVIGAGVAIFDLTQLDLLRPVTPGTPEANLEADARYVDDGYLSAHNISINEVTGFAYLTGVRKDLTVDPDFGERGGMVILDLANSLAPVEVATVTGVHTHDAQVVTYIGPDTDHAGKEIAVVFNGFEERFVVYDVTDKANIHLISEATYPGASFTHQGWLTEDHAFLLLGDEEDELFGLQDPQNPDLPDTARTYFFDLSNLDAPIFAGFFDSPAASIDHNLYVKGDRVYQANYTAGIRVLDISDIADGNVTEAAHMDTEPRLPNKHMNHNINIFVGPWGVYPFFDSGNIVASDGLNGLIIARLDE